MEQAPTLAPLATAHGHVVRRLAPADISAAADVLATAFAADPGWVALFPDEAERRAILPGIYRVVLASDIRRGRVTGVARPGPDLHSALDGVAVWHLPGDRPMEMGDRVADLLAKAALLPHARVLNRARAVSAGFAELRAAAGVGEDTADLYHLGVRPEMQGRGVGSSLVRPVLARHPHAWTETMTETNVAMYERYGFAVFGERRLPALGLRLFGMRRAG